MCIYTSDQREAETSYLSCNECEATELNKEVNSIFRILRFQYEHTMAKQETIEQSFKAELAYQFAILNGQVFCDERFQFLTIELRWSCRIESMVKGQTLYQKLVDHRQPASNDLTQRIYATINFLSFLVSYYFIFKKSEKTY